MKHYTAKLVIKEKGTNNKVKLGGKHFSQKAVDELQELFVQEMIYDPSHQVREEMLEGLAEAKLSLPAQS